jgi:hypothetical protein
MQTFMPYGSAYDQTAKCLDVKRLGKQRVETYQILKALLGETKGWRNHPATRMWEGYEFQLYVYQTAICTEWMRRGYKDTVLESSKELVQRHQVPLRSSKPEWVDNPALTITHRANLYLKDPLHYVKFEDETKEYMDYVCCPDKCKYWWYTHSLDKENNG